MDPWCVFMSNSIWLRSRIWLGLSRRCIFRRWSRSVVDMLWVSVLLHHPTSVGLQLVCRWPNILLLKVLIDSGIRFFPSITASYSSPEATNSPKPQWPSSIHLSFVRRILCQWPCGTSKWSFVNFFFFGSHCLSLHEFPSCNCKCEIWLQEKSVILKKESFDCLNKMQYNWIFCITQQFFHLGCQLISHTLKHTALRRIALWHEWPLRWLDLMTDLTLHMIERSEQMVWITCLVHFLFDFGPW